MRKYLIIIVVLLLGLVINQSPVLALDEPNNVALYEIRVFKDLLVDGDYFSVVPYNIEFTTQPPTDISKTFIFRLMSPDGNSENGSMLAYPYYHGGYGKGVIAFYFESGMVWEESYIFRVQENPAYYPESNYWDFVIGPPDYSSDADQEAALRGKLLQIATELGVEYNQELLNTSEVGMTVLSTYGELYFLNSIPGIQAICPSLFAVQIKTPDYSQHSWTYTFASSLRTKYNDTILGDFMTGYAGLFSMETNAAMNVLSIILFAVLIGISVWKFKASMLAAFTDGYCLLLLLMLSGFFSMILAGLFAFLAVVVGGIILFLNRS